MCVCVRQKQKSTQKHGRTTAFSLFKCKATMDVLKLFNVIKYIYICYGYNGCAGIIRMSNYLNYGNLFR